MLTEMLWLFGVAAAAITFAWAAARFAAGTVPGQSGANQPIILVKLLILLALPRELEPLFSP